MTCVCLCGLIFIHFYMKLQDHCNCLSTKKQLLAAFFPVYTHETYIKDVMIKIHTFLKNSHLSNKSQTVLLREIVIIYVYTNVQKGVTMIQFCFSESCRSKNMHHMILLE
ncbi:hypothetical protein X975_11636, partial [Stegodyphus mimosarum]